MTSRYVASSTVVSVVLGLVPQPMSFQVASEWLFEQDDHYSLATALGVPSLKVNWACRTFLLMFICFLRKEYADSIGTANISPSSQSYLLNFNAKYGMQRHTTHA